MEEATKIKFEAIEAENARQNQRLKELESDIKELKDIHVSVQVLANNMKQMLSEQKKQGERLEKLESRPGESWTTMQHTIFTSICGAVGAALAIGIIQLIAQNM